jgi:hypothetical protein
MITLATAYPGLQGFDVQEILTQALARARAKGQPNPTVLLYSNLRPDKYAGVVLDVRAGMVLLAVSDSHQIVDLSNIGAVSVVEKLEI